MPGVAAQELADERIRDLLRGHELHLLAGGDGAELLEREDAVLARVDEHAVQGAARGRPAGAVEGAEGGPGDERLRARGIHVVEGHGAAAPEDLAVADALPGDGGRRLDLLGDGAAGRARHQEEEEGVRAGQRALGEEHARGLLLGMGVGDVEAHAPRARGPDLDVGARARLHHRLVEDLHVADELGDVVGDEQDLEALPQVAALLERRVGVAARLVDVLVGDAGGRVHRVHDDLGPAAGDELVEVVAAGGLVGQGLDEALDEAPAQRAVAVDLAPGPVLELREREHVAPGRVQGHARALRAQRRHRLLGLAPAQGQERQLARLLLDEPPRHRLPHEAVSSEDEDALPPDVHGPGSIGATLFYASCSRTTSSLPTPWNRDRRAA